MKKEKTIEVVVCNLCEKELGGSEAKDIVVAVGGDEYYRFNLCDSHWAKLNEQLYGIRHSTGSAIDE